MFQDMISSAIANREPIVLVGDATALRTIAAATGMGLHEMQAEDVAGLDAMPGVSRGTPCRIVLVGGCERIAEGGALEMQALDLCFDGHPAIGDDDVVVLHFAEPTDMSEALADDAIPCTFVGIEPAGATADQETRLAA